MKGRMRWIVLDLLIAVAAVFAIWTVNYKIPQKGIKEEAFPQIRAEMKSPSKSGKQLGILPRTNMVLDTQDWHEKFADRFTDTVTVSKNSYTSPNLSIKLSYRHYDSGIMDKSGSGSHKKYGTQISYVLADIYLGDITCLQTAFAQGMYGVGYLEKLSDMSSKIGAVLAVNGDSYSNDRHRDNGTIVRNGVIYRNQQTDSEVCVLNWDGTMDIYSPYQITMQQLIERGAYQSWIFGPSLLDETGKAKKYFFTWSYIKQSHPRTAIGYYEPGIIACCWWTAGRKAPEECFLRRWRRCSKIWAAGRLTIWMEGIVRL